MFRIVFDQLERLNQACYANFIRFNKATYEERVSFTEHKMGEEFSTRHKFSILFNKSAEKEITEDELPASRILAGPERTNLPFAEASEAVKPFADFNSDDNGKRSALHATLEHTERNSGMRFARTLFL